MREYIKELSQAIAVNFYCVAVIFVILKGFGIAPWSWFVVLSPFWATCIVAVFVWVLFMSYATVMTLIGTVRNLFRMTNEPLLAACLMFGCVCIFVFVFRER